jgi:hypothetical protein
VRDGRYCVGATADDVDGLAAGTESIEWNLASHVAEPVEPDVERVQQSLWLGGSRGIQRLEQGRDVPKPDAPDPSQSRQRCAPSRSPSSMNPACKSRLRKRRRRGRLTPELARIEGHRGSLVLRHSIGEDEVGLTVMTFWESTAAIGRFAGPTPDLAVVEPEARAVRSSFDERVRYDEVVVARFDSRPEGVVSSG